MGAVAKRKYKEDLIKYTAQFQLKSQLEHYGLNPNDWRFTQFDFTQDGSEGHAELKHIRDANLRIRGEIHRQPFRLQSIMKWAWSDLAWHL